jgi:glycine cleavage system H protein
MADIEGYSMPDDLLYHEEDTWLKIEGDQVRVGMTDFFQKAAGDIVYVDLPFEGDEVEQGEAFGKAQSAKWIGKLIAPLSGTIEEVNYDLDSDSTVINKDPYGDGWVMLLTPSDLEGQKDSLIQGLEGVTDLIKRHIEKAEKLKEEGGGGEE